MSDVGAFIFACVMILFLFVALFFLVFGLLNPCHPWVHAIKDCNYCGYCGEQLQTVCECGEIVTGWDFCPECGLAVCGG